MYIATDKKYCNVLSLLKSKDVINDSNTVVVLCLRIVSCVPVVLMIFLSKAPANKAAS